MNIMPDCVSPVDVSVVKKKYGIICGALHRGHGSVHEDMQSCMHAPAGTVS